MTLLVGRDQICKTSYFEEKNRPLYCYLCEKKDKNMYVVILFMKLSANIVKFSVPGLGAIDDHYSQHVVNLRIFSSLLLHIFNKKEQAN